MFSAAANVIFYSVETLYKLWGDCQVGPRFPVLALFTNHNVFHPPQSPHLHLFIQPVVQRRPLAPLPHTAFCYMCYIVQSDCLIIRMSLFLQSPVLQQSVIHPLRAVSGFTDMFHLELCSLFLTTLKRQMYLPTSRNVQVSDAALRGQTPHNEMWHKNQCGGLNTLKCENVSTGSQKCTFKCKFAK